MTVSVPLARMDEPWAGGLGLGFGGLAGVGLIVAYVHGGTSLGPGGSVGRGMALGAATYVAAGISTMAAILALSGESPGDILFDAPWVLVYFLLLWPLQITPFLAGMLAH